MSQVINTNMQSLFAQANLRKTQNLLGNTLEKLSTGFRINSAKDDSAGLAISERFTSKINGLNQAIRNANDGISFSQTGESALSSITENLQRIRELAVQSSNGSNSAGDRVSLNEEVNSLIQEISSITSNTEFNGKSILNNIGASFMFQVGSSQGQMISVNGVDSRTSQLGNFEAVNQGIDVDTLENLSSIGITAVTFEVAGVSFSTTAISGSTQNGVTELENIVAEMNNLINDSNDADVQKADARAYLRYDDNGNVGIALTANFASQDGVNKTGDTVEITSGGEISVDGTVEVSDLTATASTVTINNIDVLTRENSSKAISAIDGALERINKFRSNFGSIENRFNKSISNLTNMKDNMEAARSRIRDVDFAAETAELTRLQILQQSGLSILGQANASPQSVLSLLR